jgi:hypothetical protein
MNPAHSIPRLTVRLTTAAVLRAMPTMLYAQEDRPEEDEQQVEQQMLEDFGNGLCALGALLDDPEIDMKELWQIAAEAVTPAEDQDFESSQQQEELEGFREVLKSSVMNGSMSRNEALSMLQTSVNCLPLGATHLAARSRLVTAHLG